MICILSGGGQKYKVAYLNYSSFLPYSESTPHVLCVFIKPRDVIEYRKRYPEHILVELPPASDSLFVGDARHWIMAFVTQLRLNDAARCDAAPQRFFARCFMLDDDVTCVHRGDVPVTLAVMLQEMSKKIESMDTPPLLVGVHCRSGRSPSAEWWVADGPTPLATALSVSTDVNIQLDVHFHPLAQLGEDVDFDQRLRLAAPEERVGALKCNLFSYTRASSGNDVGADRVPTEFASMLVKVMEEIGFDPMQRVDVTGTYPLLKDIHGWSWQKVTLKEERRPFKDTRFLFTRPGGLNHLHAVSQGVLLRISDDDLPHSSPINWVTTETTFRLKLKLKGSGLMIMPLEDVPLNVRNGTEILGRAPLNVPWQAQGHDPTMYAFIKVEAAAAAAPSLQLPKATQKLPLLETVAVGFRISLYDAPPRPTSWEGVQKEAARQAAEAQVAEQQQTAAAQAAAQAAEAAERQREFEASELGQAEARLGKAVQEIRPGPDGWTTLKQSATRAQIIELFRLRPLNISIILGTLLEHVISKCDGDHLLQILLGKDYGECVLPKIVNTLNSPEEYDLDRLRKLKYKNKAGNQLEQLLEPLLRRRQKAAATSTVSTASEDASSFRSPQQQGRTAPRAITAASPAGSSQTMRGSNTPGTTERPVPVAKRKRASRHGKRRIALRFASV